MILIVVVISELIPDVPKSVKLEIQREKLLANEAKRNRKDEPKKEVGANNANITAHSTVCVTCQASSYLEMH